MAEKQEDLKFPHPSNTAVLRPKDFEFQESGLHSDKDISKDLAGIDTWLWTGRDKMVCVAMDGRDPLLQRDKRKRKRGWESVRLHLGKRKTTDQDGQRSSF